MACKCKIDSVSLSNLSQNIKNIMNELEMNQIHFSERIGITQGFLSDICNQKANITIPRLDIIATQLNTTTSVLLDQPQKIDIREVIKKMISKANT